MIRASEGSMGQSIHRRMSGFRHCKANFKNIIYTSRDCKMLPTVLPGEHDRDQCMKGN
jgi:hypothetical protein